MAAIFLSEKAASKALKESPADKLYRLMRENDLPLPQFSKYSPEGEFRITLTRQWRADFCWPAFRLLVEFEGGVFVGGAHGRGVIYSDNCEKYNAAQVLGWRVIRFTSPHINSGYAIRLLRYLLTEASPDPLAQSVTHQHLPIIRELTTLTGKRKAPRKPSV